MTIQSRRQQRPLIDSPAADRARLRSDKPGEFHFGDTLDYINFVSSALQQSGLKYSNVAQAGDMSATTVSKMAHRQTRFPRFGTITGILGAMGYETIIRAGPAKKEEP